MFCSPSPGYVSGVNGSTVKQDFPCSVRLRTVEPVAVEDRSCATVVTSSASVPPRKARRKFWQRNHYGKA